MDYPMSSSWENKHLKRSYPTQEDFDYVRKALTNAKVPYPISALIYSEETGWKGYTIDKKGGEAYHNPSLTELLT